MIKQSLIVIATLGMMTMSASAVSTTACVGCHGKDFEKKALNVSKIVKDMKKDEIIASLKGYKEGKGGAMKALMAGQVKALSDKDIEEIATQIAGGGEAKAESNATAESNTTKTAESNVTKKEDANATKK